MSTNNFMRLIVMFDLPVVEKEDRRNAAQFRKFLIDNGYMMMQYSVYYRIVNGLDMAKKHEIRLKNNVPHKGSIRVLRITEKQFNSMKILVGYAGENENKVNSDLLTKF